jgi:proteic killer suppression protein
VYSPSGVIRTFSCRETEKLFHGFTVRSFPTDLRRRARTKLLILHASTSLDDLKSPPGNRLEALTGDRNGQHSIRINQQYRLCFRWSEQGADQVEITDSH